MKSKNSMLIKKDIDRMRLELYKLIESSEPDNDIVRKVSCELDDLILCYYRNEENKKRIAEIPRKAKERLIDFSYDKTSGG